MHAGERFELDCPAHFARGGHSFYADDDEAFQVPPNTDLTYQLTVIDCQANKGDLQKNVKEFHDMIVARRAKQEAEEKAREEEERKKAEAAAKKKKSEEEENKEADDDKTKKPHAPSADVQEDKDNEQK